MFYLFKLFFVSFLFFTCNTLFASSNIKSLNLSISKDELAIGDSATLVLEALMDDNETKVIDSDIEWIINKPALVSIDGLTLTALDEGEVTLQANHKNTLSSALHINIYKEINGYKLPPEPDPKINNSTILGIDSNGNGVRDDVERWIYARYDTYIPCVEHEINVTITDGRIVKSYETICEDTPVPYHQIVREIAMQAARAAQIIIDAPERARETTELESAVIQCEGYFSVWAIDSNHKLIPNNEDIGNSKEFNGLQYNTTERIRAYAKYNYNLSGGVYSVNTDINIMKESCNFDVDALLEVQP